MMPHPSPAIEATGAGLRMDGRWLVHDVTMRLDAGSLIAFVGPNGAGKSTMLGLIAGDTRPTAGRLLLHGEAPHQTKAKALARRRAVMVQEQRAGFAYSVAETVALGRMSIDDADPDADADAIDAALGAADLAPMRDRDVTTLSGGEHARAAYARVLVQETPVILLDEPTAALDLRHQEAVMTSAGQAAKGGACVIAVLHDLSLAARHADRVVVFADGTVVADGAPAAVLTPEVIERVYGQPVHVIPHPDSGAPVIVPR